MELYRGFAEIAQLPNKPKNCVATIGNFDGVHQGHRKIFSELIQKAKEIRGNSVVITFKPHPQIALHPGKKFELLNTYTEKLELLESLGIDIVIEEPFSREFSNMTADFFINEYLLDKLDLHSLYLGYDFAFGKGRTGSIHSIQKNLEPKNIALKEIAACFHEGIPISSSRIRNYLDEGRMLEANFLLGRNFFVRGLVVKGVGRGKKIGIPTANLAIEDRKIPKLGVYATQVVWQEKKYPSISNVGICPTFQKDGEELRQAVIETHIFDFSQNIYGHPIQVEFKEYLREEKKFSSVEELISQIQKDITRARFT